MCLATAQVLLGARSEHHWLRLCYGAARAPVPVPAQAARIPQAPEGCCSADLRGRAVPGDAVPVVGRRAAAVRCAPAAINLIRLDAWWTGRPPDPDPDNPPAAAGPRSMNPKIRPENTSTI